MKQDQFIFKKILIIVIPILLIGLFLLLFKFNRGYVFNHSWEQAVPNQQVPKGLTSLSAKECGKCHLQHYQEWQTSTHAMAWKDEQFQAEIKKKTSPYMCINCHIPLQNQQAYIVTGLKDDDIYKPIKKKNKNFNHSLQQEGITCSACHVRNGAVIGMKVSNRAPHKSVANPTHLSEQLCISCHNAVEVVTPELVCTFQTGDEWKAGPYAKTKNCKSCHMPIIERATVAGSPKQKSHMHYFMGSGIPKLDSLHPERLDGLHYTFDLIKKNYSSKDTVVLQTTVTNKFAGHRVPTGDPERFIITKISIFDTSSNRLVAQDSFRIGEHWEWYPVAKKISDNNLFPGDSITYSIHKWLSVGAYKFILEAFKYRTTDELIRYNKLSHHYPSHILFYSKEIPFKVN